jgi:hypothetical protein
MTTMTDNNKTENGTAAFELPSVEGATQGIRDLNERWMASARNAGLVTLDAQEKVLNSIVELEKKAASDSQVEWVSALATTHATFLSEMTGSYAAAVRDLLK